VTVALAQEAQTGCRGLSIRILKIAIKKHLQSPNVNYAQVRSVSTKSGHVVSAMPV